LVADGRRIKKGCQIIRRKRDIVLLVVCDGGVNEREGKNTCFGSGKSRTSFKNIPSRRKRGKHHTVKRRIK